MANHVKVPHYSGWLPRHMRRRSNSRNKTETSAVSRQTKRSRLGSSKNRTIYKSAHGYKHTDYPAICRIVDAIHSR